MTMLGPTVRQALTGLLLVLWLCAAPALAETRSALVIGNDSYHSVPALKNARNDARAMAAELEKLGFSVVLKEDASAKDLETAVKSWTGSLDQTDVALFFYAGHGVQVEGVNYLVPTDFEGDEIDVKHSCLSAEMVRERMEKSGPDTNIIVLDACRNNPFSTSRGGSRGLVFMEGNVGTLIAFATSPGGVSDDNPADGHGLFTKHLLANLSVPGLEALQVFQNVGRGVYHESKGAQRPWISASVMPRSFYFVPGSASPVSTTGGPPTTGPQPGQLSAGGVEPVETPAVASAAPTNVGRVPKSNIVLLLIADTPAQTAWLLEHTRKRIYQWYGGADDGTGDITLNVEFISYSDAAGRETALKNFGIKRNDLPVMISAFKIDGKWAGSIARHRRVDESTELGPFFDTIFEPKMP